MHVKARTNVARQKILVSATMSHRKVICGDNVEDTHVTDLLLLDVSTGQLSSVTGNSGSKAATGALSSIGHDALGRKLRFAVHHEKFRVSVADLPLLSKLIGIIKNGDVVTSHVSSGLVVAQEAYGSSILVITSSEMEVEAHHVFEDLDSEVSSIAKINDERVLLVTLHCVFNAMARNCIGHVHIGNTIENVLAPS